MRRLAEPSYALVYASILPGLQDVAREHGYALAVHGSMATDLDLIACPWTDEASEPSALVDALCGLMRLYAPELRREDDPNPSTRPHGRLAYCLHFNHRTNKDLPHGGPYVDLSVMPRLAS